MADHLGNPLSRRCSAITRTCRMISTTAWREPVVKATRQALAWGQSPANVLAYGLVAGMDVVGKDFGAGILFVPEVLRAANAMKAAMEVCARCWSRPACPRSAPRSSARSRATSTTSARTWSA